MELQAELIYIEEERERGRAKHGAQGMRNELRGMQLWRTYVKLSASYTYIHTVSDISFWAKFKTLLFSKYVHLLIFLGFSITNTVHSLTDPV